MSSRFFLLFMLSLIFGVSCNSSKKMANKTPKAKPAPTSVDFIYNIDKDLTSVIEIAEKAGKHVFVDFYADWCLPCQMMDEEVFNYPELYQYMNSNFINYKVNVEKTNGANLRFLFGAEQLPTLLFIDKKGKVLKRYEGSTMITTMLEMAKEASSIPVIRDGSALNE